MSRTYKDQPLHIRFEDRYNWKDKANWHKFEYEVKMIGYRTGTYWYEDRKKIFVPFDKPIPYEYTVWLKKPGVKRKKKKNDDTVYHWMSTPGWWIRVRMDRPQRRKSHLWEKQVVQAKVEDLEDEDPPIIGRKPHVYYW